MTIRARPLAFALLAVAALTMACSAGMRRRAKPAEGFPTGYDTWTRVNTDPIVRTEDGQMRFLFASPGAVVDGQGFAPGTVLVKEQRRMRGSEQRPQAGEAFLVATMTKGDDGRWQYGAWDPASGQPSISVDVDGCAFCHDDRKDTDSTFSAYSALR